MTTSLDITTPHLAIVRALLRAHLPAGNVVHVFGSRMLGRDRRYSDLDLALESDGAPAPDVIAARAEALSESDLPCRVDLVDLALVDPAFRDRVLRDAQALAWCMPISVLRPTGRRSFVAGSRSVPRCCHPAPAARGSPIVARPPG